jgi:site-specific DNA-methyltransferase (adenine-specific)
MSEVQIISGDCTEALQSLSKTVDLTFLDPPFNQNKHYNQHDDNLPEEKYWQWMKAICERIYDATSDGGALYFMQREKNTGHVLHILKEAGWTYQNLIIWKKMTSAVPSNIRFGKHFQTIVFATKGNRPRIFNKLRIDPPLPENYKHKRKNGMFVTDVWDDIRELTSGYFAGDEAIRTEDGNRLHKQQAPIALLLRIILSSSKIGDVVLDPFAGTGTTCVVATQLNRSPIGIEIDPTNVACIQDRLDKTYPADSISRFYNDYIYTENLEKIWKVDFQKLGEGGAKDDDLLDLPLFRQSNTK